MDYYTEEQRRKIKQYLSEQRWRDAESGTHALGNHEIGFDEAGNLLTAAMEVPEELPEGADPAFAAFFQYYAKRARHPRAVNFVSSWTATMPVSFWNFPLMTNIKEISSRPILLVAGENAHSRYYSEDAYAAAQEPKELVIVPGADHVDLYASRFADISAVPPAPFLIPSYLSAGAGSLRRAWLNDGHWPIPPGRPFDTFAPTHRSAGM